MLLVLVGGASNDTSTGHNGAVIVSLLEECLVAVLGRAAKPCGPYCFPLVAHPGVKGTPKFLSILGTWEGKLLVVDDCSLFV